VSILRAAGGLASCDNPTIDSVVTKEASSKVEFWKCKFLIALALVKKEGEASSPLASHGTPTRSLMYSGQGFIVNISE
jgi:hypothetical protein